MKKRVFAVFIAVVMIITAINFAPEIQTTQAYSNKTINTTWDNSYHALSDDIGTKSAPGYVGKYTYTMTQSQDEFSMPDKFLVMTFNDCEREKDPNNSSKSLLVNSSETSHEISAGIDNVPAKIKNLKTGNNTGSKAYYSALSKNYSSAQETKNMGTRVFNYNKVDVTEYRYLRFQMYCQNIRFDTSKTPYYFRVFFRDASGKTLSSWQADESSQFKNGNAYDFLIDIAGVEGVVSYIDLHLMNVQRASTNKSDEARVWYDNFRLIKNTTNTNYFSYEPKYKSKSFHGCDSDKYTQTVSYKSGGYGDQGKYVIRRFTNQEGSSHDGKGSVVFGPNDTGNTLGYGVNHWYQIAFQNTNGINPSEYGYFQFYFTLGSSWNFLKSSYITVFMSTEADYAGASDKGTISSTVETFGSIQLPNYAVEGEWYSITLDCRRVNKLIKSISIQFGDGIYNIASPGTNHDSAKIHIDDLHFFGYDYQPQTKYKYYGGHYTVLEDFEGLPDDNRNNTRLAHALSQEAIDKGVCYQKSSGGNYAYKYGSRVTGPGGKDLINTAIYDVVTQGNYALWWGPQYTDTSNTSSFVEYNLGEKTGGSVDLSKFTHYSLDFGIRSMQGNNNNYNKQMGLTGNNEKFKITFYDTVGNQSNLTFAFKKNSSSYDFIETNGHGVQGFPLRGFVPGSANRYTPHGAMRLIFPLGEIVEHGSNTSTDPIDITKVSRIRIIYCREGTVGVDYEKTNTNRRTEFFLDNFVGYTPDMTLTVENTNVDSTFADGQRFAYTLKGTDAVTRHVNTEFSIPANGTEVIKHIPLNGYEIVQIPWSWRFTKNKSNIRNTRTCTNYTIDMDEPRTDRQIGYKLICDHPEWYIYQTTTFAQTLENHKWLDHNSYSYKYASDIS